MPSQTKPQPKPQAQPKPAAAESSEVSTGFIRKLNLISPSFGVPRQNDAQFLLQNKTISGDISLVLPPQGSFSPVVAAGWVRVKLIGGEASGQEVRAPFEIDDPDITSVKPLQALIGTTITITGTNFETPAGKVVFQDGIIVNPVTWTNTSITVVIPTGAETGSLFLITAEGKFSNAVHLNVEAPVTVTTELTLIRVRVYDDDGNRETVGQCLLDVTATGVAPSGGTATPPSSKPAPPSKPAAPPSGGAAAPAAATTPAQGINISFPFLSDLNVTSIVVTLLNLAGTVSIEAAVTSGDPEALS